jgi:hypothetical protein
LGGWTRWRKLADEEYWYDDYCDHDGPACYELGVGSDRGTVAPTYVGETGNERRRMSAYARHGSHLSSTIDSYLDRGYVLYYRGLAVDTKSEAREIQDFMLSNYEYEWNQIGNSEYMVPAETGDGGPRTAPLSMVVMVGWQMRLYRS